MIIPLEDAKIYLRIDGDEENTLISDFIIAAEDICEGILRFALSTFEVVPGPVKQAVLYATAQFYELRDEINMKELLETIKRLLFAYRNEGW